MCLAVPARIVALSGPRAVVDVDGVRREAIVALIGRPRVGEVVLLHAGFAIRKWSAADLAEYRAIVRGQSAGAGRRRGRGAAKTGRRRADRRPRE